MDWIPPSMLMQSLRTWHLAFLLFQDPFCFVLSNVFHCPDVNCSLLLAVGLTGPKEFVRYLPTNSRIRLQACQTCLAFLKKYLYAEIHGLITSYILCIVIHLTSIQARTKLILPNSFLLYAVLLPSQLHGSSYKCSKKHTCLEVQEYRCCLLHAASVSVCDAVEFYFFGQGLNTWHGCPDLGNLPGM